MRLWDYAVQVYGVGGIKDCLLTLQDKHGGDVNIALWCLWCGHQNIAVPGADVPSILSTADSITAEVVRPLRRARRALSAPRPEQDATAFAVLRQDVLALELRAEQLVLQQLERATLETCSRSADRGGMHETASSLFMLALKHMDIAPTIDDEGDPESPTRLFASILMLAKDHGP
ncbi:MAG: TIGR02444 family protein [Pseudomonadota bacterium]